MKTTIMIDITNKLYLSNYPHLLKRTSNLGRVNIGLMFTLTFLAGAVAGVIFSK